MHMLITEKQQRTKKNNDNEMKARDPVNQRLPYLLDQECEQDHLLLVKER